jgi:hypothetical protein
MYVPAGVPLDEEDVLVMEEAASPPQPAIRPRNKKIAASTICCRRLAEDSTHAIDR